MDMNNKKGKASLYNIAKDPSETTNYYYDEAYAEKKAELTSALNKIILDGRSTEGTAVTHEGPKVWNQLFWLKKNNNGKKKNKKK